MLYLAKAIYSLVPNASLFGCVDPTCLSNHSLWKKELISGKNVLGTEETFTAFYILHPQHKK